MPHSNSTIICRAYTPDDRAACLAIFDSLTPRFFKAGEKDEFTSFLDGLDNDKCRFAVIEDQDSKIIACGGMWMDKGKGVASLCWEMVHKDQQGQGIGHFMLEARIGWMREIPELTHVVASAASHSAGFFQKQGFQVYHTEKDYFGPGLDLLDMKLRLRN